MGHDNADVQKAFLTLHHGQEDSPLLALCRRYALYHDTPAGAEAAAYLSDQNATLSDTTALECLKLILDSNHSSLSAAQDAIIVGLLRRHLAVRQYFANELRDSPTEFFDNIYDRGGGATDGLRSIVLDSQLWQDEDRRTRAEADLFQLLLAKLMESGHDLDARALKGVALLLVADADRLHSLIDAEAFDAILASLDITLPAEVRSQATVATSKFLEVSPEESRKLLVNFVTSRMHRQRDQDVILAFSATANLFPIVPAVAAPLLLTRGFLQSIIPVLDKKSRTAAVNDAFLQLLNAACIDEACRSAMGKFCSEWLSNMVERGSGNQPAIAATVLAKLTSATSSDTNLDHRKGRSSEAGDRLDTLLRIFKEEVSRPDGSTPADCIEGLAYASLRPEAKEKLAYDQTFLSSFLRTLKMSSNRPEILIGGLSIIANLTQYTPRMSEEQQKLADLKAYANAAQPRCPHALNDDQHVAARCAAVIAADVMPVLVDCSKRGTTAARSLVEKIVLSLASSSQHRPKIAQQGAVSLLLHHLQPLAETTKKQTEHGLEATHALAKILISVNPSLVFPPRGLPSITSAVRPLVQLLSNPSSGQFLDQPRDLLPIFESLLALTNLASSPDLSAATLIVRTAWPDIEEVMLHHHDMIRRAACELVCNLSATPAGITQYTDGSPSSIQRLNTLVAMADVDDLPTRRAAGGALAMLTEHEAAIAGVLEIERTVKVVMALCQDESDEVAHRGLVCLHNLASASDELGGRAREKLQEVDAVTVLRERLRRCQHADMKQLTTESLRALAE